MRRVFAFLFALAFLGITSSALADVPTEMSVQGKLTNGAGAPVPAGLKNFTFKIWDAPAGGTEIWPAGPGELQTLTTDANGLWNAGVGQIIPLTEAVFLSPVRWLEVTVNDGVNPIETLPRIELRTNPYTYRSATSQQADSLGGMTLGDLMDKFVDEAADTMSGQLRIDWSHPDLGRPNLEIENSTTGSTWNYTSGTWGLGSDVASDNSNWNIGIGSSARGDNIASANYGIYSSAMGFSGINFGVYANAFSGTLNYAGYFDGDVAVIGGSGGDASVQLPADAISSVEILNEPGIAQGLLAGAVALGSNNLAWTTITSVTIATPADGYIHLHGRCYVDFSGGTSGQAFLQVSDVANGPSAIGIYSLVTSTVSAGNFDELCNHRTYFKSAGTHTFYLEGYENYTGAVAAGYATLTATFFPTSYGAVATVAAQGEQGDFASATAILAAGSAVGSPEQGGAAAPIYEVDLRELELKVAKAEAEVEKARRELIEAHTSSIRGTGPAIGTVIKEPRQ